LKVQKNGTGEHLPPPRPKRKAAHPYPHKASKKALQVVLPQQTSRIMEQGCGTSIDTATVATDLSANDAFPSWENDPVQHLSPRHTQGSGATNNYSSSIGSQSGTWPTSEATEQDIMLPALRGELLFQLCPCKCFADTNFLTLLWLSWTHFNMLFVQIVFYSSPP